MADGETLRIELHKQPRLQTVATVLAKMRYRYGSEVQLHEVMGQVLTAAGIEFEREYRIDAHNRADFWLGGLVIEVKTDGSVGAALRQVNRYIALPQVRGVLLAATPLWANTQLPRLPEWGSKPLAMIRLARQAL